MSNEFDDFDSKGVGGLEFFQSKFEGVIEDLVHICLEGKLDEDQSTDVKLLTVSISRMIEMVLGNVLLDVSAYVERSVSELLEQRKVVDDLVAWSKLEMSVENPLKWVEDNFIVIDGVLKCRHKKFIFEKNPKLVSLPENVEFYEVSLVGCVNFERLPVCQLHSLSVVNCPKFSKILAGSKIENLRIVGAAAVEIENGCEFGSVVIERSGVESLSREMNVRDFSLIDAIGPVVLPSFRAPELQTFSVENIAELTFTSENLRAEHKMFFLNSGIVDLRGGLLCNLFANRINLLDVDVRDLSKLHVKELVLDNCSVEVLSGLDLESLTVLRCLQLEVVGDDCIVDVTSFKECPNIRSIPDVFNIDNSRFLKVL